jgi:hypothetical protein
MVITTSYYLDGSLQTNSSGTKTSKKPDIELLLIAEAFQEMEQSRLTVGQSRGIPPEVMLIPGIR